MVTGYEANPLEAGRVVFFKSFVGPLLMPGCAPQIVALVVQTIKITVINFFSSLRPHNQAVHGNQSRLSALHDGGLRVLQAALVLLQPPVMLEKPNVVRIIY